MMLKELKQSCDIYIKAFEEKQGLTSVRWVEDIITGMVEFEEGFYFNFFEIVLDIELNAPKGIILYWHNLVNTNTNAQDNYKQFLIEFCN